MTTLQNLINDKDYALNKFLSIQKLMEQHIKETVNRDETLGSEIKLLEAKLSTEGAVLEAAELELLNYEIKNPYEFLFLVSSLLKTCETLDVDFSTFFESIKRSADKLINQTD